MRQLVAISFVFWIHGALSTAAQGQVSSSFLRAVKMESAWRSQVQLPSYGRGLVSSQLWADERGARQFAIVELPGRTIRVPADLPDRDGNPIGLEEAKQRAQESAARLLGRNDGFEVVEATVPMITLVLVTSDGLVQALDAENGKLLWATPCGNASAPAYPGAVSAVGVSVLHGEELHVLDWHTGKNLLTQRLRSLSSNAIAVCDDVAFVTDYTGRLDSYALGDRPINRYGYVIAGRAVGQPVSLGNNQFCAIASDAGFVYIFSGGERPSEWLRYDSSSAITGSLSAGMDAFYVGNGGGIIRKITVLDRLGRISWEFHSGDPITAPPLVVGDRVIVASETGAVAGLDDSNGEVVWADEGASVLQPIAKCGNDVFCISKSGQLVAYDDASGHLVAATRPLNLSLPVINQLHDRVFLVTKAGHIQCLRKVNADLPTVIGPVHRPASEESGAPVQPATGGDGAVSGGGANVFGTGDGANPFEAGGASSPDPFSGPGAGTSGNPFETAPVGNPFDTDAAGASDPFGASNPFGETNNSNNSNNSSPF